MRILKILIGLFMVLFAIIIVSSFFNRNEPPLAEIEKQFRKEYGYKESMKNEIPPDSVYIVVDVTGSMKGFYEAGKSLGEFLQDLNASFEPKPITYYAFSKRIEPLENYFPLLTSRLYKAEETRYGCLNSFIKGKGAVLLITDLQFNKDTDRRSFTDIIRLFMEDSNNFVKILGNKADFNGKYYPRGGKSSSRYKGKRPIYAIIFAKNQYRSYIEKAIDNSKIWEEELSFYNKFPVDIILDNEFIDSCQTNYYTDFVVNGSKNSIVVYDYDIGKINLYLTLRSDIFEKWGNFDDKDILIAAYQICYGDSSITFDKNVKIETVAKVFEDTNNNEIPLKISISNFMPSKDYLLVVQVNPHNLPQWIYDWSIAEDEKPLEQADHTLYLKRVVEDIIRSVTSPYILGYSLIYLKNNYI